ncbi:MAG: BlaI/MecI/CopY family transcriptional regulator [Planctomycetia bacterium]|nr:BlaI/MecI/CopY family transcriptional regulator [Planctomycetia bacterium]
MRKKPRYKMGDLQLRIMQVLWDASPATVAQVHEALGAKSGLAYTTIATMLRKMEDRGLVAHETADRRFVYQALVSESEVSRGMANDVLERLFEGSLPNLVSHLLRSREVSPEELDRLQELIAQKRRAK